MPRQEEDDEDGDNDDYSPYVSNIETSFLPMDISFHPHRDNLVAAVLVDGSLESKSCSILYLFK